MFRKQAFLFGIVLIFLSGCASAPVKDIQIDSHANPKANFSGYKTYAWLGSATIVNDTHGQWEPPGFDADKEIKFLMNRELRNRGMSEDRTAPDLLVVFAAGVDMDALGLKIDPETQVEVFENLPKGGLVVAFVDRESGFVIWVGAATGDVQENADKQTVKARLNYAVKQLSKKIPK